MKKRVWALAGLLMICAIEAPAQDNRPQGSELDPVPAILPVDKFPEFEVADIVLSKSGGQPRAQFLPGGKVQFQSLPLKFMVLAAWGYENDEGRVKGGPAWTNTDQYDIVAKATPTTKIPELRLMLRALLIKRFGLEMHMEDVMTPVYALEKGKGALKITESTGKAPLDCARSVEDAVIIVNCHNMTLDELAAALRGMAPAYVDKPVVNLTGLTGPYDFKLGWTPRGRLLGNGEGRGGAADSGAKPDSAPNAAEPTAGITVFEAVEKYMGLKMTSTKHAVPVVVIDKINRTPIEN